MVVIADVFVHPSAVNGHCAYMNNHKPMRHAVGGAVEGRPSAEEAVKNKDKRRHPFKYKP